MFRNYRKESKEQEWGTNSDSMSIEQINCGSLLRIADAVEKMTQRYDDLLNEHTRLKKQIEWLKAKENHQVNIIRGLRGTVTRMKSRP